MTNCAHDGGSAPLTRRQLRDRERQTLARVTGSAARDQAETTTLHLGDLPLPSRRELRGPAAPRKSTMAPRLAIAACLGALTIAAPLTGIIGEQSTPTAHALSEAMGATVPAAADGFAAAVVNNEAEGAPQLSKALRDDPVAATRATTLSASRTLDRTIGACEPAIEGASGLRAALQEREDVAVVMPLVDGVYRKTSPYGTRVHPIFGAAMKHEGTDLAAPAGTPIHAVADGTVIHAGNGIDGRSSMLVIVEHEINGEKVQTWYVHMFRDGVFVEEGQKVKAGDVIAAVGNYGNSTGPHLHLEVHVGADMHTIDPLPWLDEVGAISPGSC